VADNPKHGYKLHCLWRCSLGKTHFDACAVGNHLLGETRTPRWCICTPERFVVTWSRPAVERRLTSSSASTVRLMHH
jgi:hypothetical protein